MLKEWKRASRIVLEANPDYRGFTWDFAADPGDAVGRRRSSRRCSGKTMPQIGRVEISIIEEDQSHWLAFRQKQLDLLNLPATFRTEAFEPDDKLKPALVDEGVSRVHVRSIRRSSTRSSISAIRWSAASRRRRSRCAARSSWRTTSTRRSTSSARARRCAAEMPIPHGVVGHDPDVPLAQPATIPMLANKLLDRFGYKKGADGYRTLPDGKPLVHPLGDAARRGRPRAQRAVEEVDGRDRHPHGVRRRASSPTTSRRRRRASS